MPPDLAFLRSTRYQLTVAITTAVFFTLFLLVFLPFGVNNYDPNHHYTGEFLLAMSSMGLSTGLVTALNEFALARRLPRPTGWSSVIGWWLWLCLCIGAANFLLYNWWGSWHDLHWASAGEFILDCAAILIFPLVGCFLHFRHRALHQRFVSELALEQRAMDPEQLLTFSGTGASDHIVLRLKDFLHAKAQDNYVELRFVVGDAAQTHLLRATLANLAEQLQDAGIVRCHRSFLVNLRRVVAVRGSGTRLTLMLDQNGESVPVSRSFAEGTLAALKEIGGRAEAVTETAPAGPE